MDSYKKTTTSNAKSKKVLYRDYLAPLNTLYNLSYLIDQPRIKQRSLTLLDLKNAFGEVDHMLIKTTLGYHHIPDFASDIILNIYNDFYMTILTKSYATDFIRVEKGVLQEDSLSALLFNMVINTFIQHIKKEYYTQLGYSFHKAFYPPHWFQFADDAAVICERDHLVEILNRIKNKNFWM